MKRVLLGLVLAAAGGAWVAAAQGDADKIFNMVNKCQIEALDAALEVFPAGDLNRPNAQGVPLMVRAAETTCDQGIEKMIQVGGDPNAADSTGRTVLHAAAEKSTEKVVKMLLKRGASVDAKTKSGETVLQFAEKNNYKGKTDERDKIIKALKEKGAKLRP